MEKNDELPMEGLKQHEPTENNQVNYFKSSTNIISGWHSAKSTIDGSLVHETSHKLLEHNFNAELEAKENDQVRLRVPSNPSTIPKIFKSAENALGNIDVGQAASNSNNRPSRDESYVETWLNNLGSTSSITSDWDTVNSTIWDTVNSTIWDTVNSTIEDSSVYEPKHELPTQNFDPVIDEGDENQILYLDKNTGKKSLLVGARNFKIKWGKTPEPMKWTFCGDSRFSEVAQLQDVWYLDIKCKIETQKLSQQTLYGAYLLFKLGNPIFGLETVGGVVRFKDRESGSESARKAFLLHLHQGYPVDRLIQRETGRFPVMRDDGWMEIELGDFYNEKGDGSEVEARLMEIKRLHKKGGLIVEAIEFRPKTSFSHSALLGDIEPNFFIDEKSGKKCVVIGARELVIAWEETPEKWLWTRPTNSRFLEVAQLKRVHWLEVKCKIELRMLLPETNYGAYLVFKLADVFYGLEKVKRVVRFVGRESGKDAARRSSPVHLHLRTKYPPERQTGCFAVSRDDGWMEVELGEFYVHQGDDDEVEARLLDTEDRKSGLIVEAIEFRPK